jgi:hypothetical protein
MELVRIARFADLTEAQVAASALRASGIDVLVQGENHSQTFSLIQQALGGVGLWVPEDDADDAKAFVAARRAQPREPVDNPRPVRSLLAAVVGLMLGGA